MTNYTVRTQDDYVNVAARSDDVDENGFLVLLDENDDVVARFRDWISSVRDEEAKVPPFSG